MNDALAREIEALTERCEELETSRSSMVSVRDLTIQRLTRDNAQLTEQLTSVQQRCTDLLMELRDVRANVLLPGWSCKACGVFVGDVKERRTHCRSCNAPRT